MTLKTIKFEGKTFEYDDDFSWEKWQDFSVEKMTQLEKVKWYVHHVIKTKNLLFTDALSLYRLLEVKFKLSEAQNKLFLRNVGKVCRGHRVEGYGKRAIEYVVLKGMNGGIRRDDFQKMSYHDVLFLKRMLDVEVHIQNEEVRKQEAAMNAQIKG